MTFVQAVPLDQSNNSQIIDIVMNYEHNTGADEGLELNEVIQLALKNNIQLRKVQLDYRQLDSQYLSYQTIYSPILMAEGYYGFTKTPESGMSFLTGDEMTEKGANISLTKPFKTGTAITAGLSNTFLSANDPGVPGLVDPQPDYHQPTFFLDIQQSLLKNGFGKNDQKTHEMIKNGTLSGELMLKYQMSGIIAGIITDYWTVKKAELVQQTSEIEYLTYEYIRDALSYMVELGTMEKYYLNQFNALVYSSQAKLLNNQLSYDNSLRKLKYDLNYSKEQNEIILAKMTEDEISLEIDQLIKKALENRADYQTALKQRETASLNYQVVLNQSLPELTLSYQLAGLGQDEQLSEAISDSMRFKDYNQRIALTYTQLLDNQENKTAVRNAKFQLKQAQMEVEDTEQKIRMEVLNAAAQVETAYQNLLKSRQAAKESRIYLNSLLKRLKQGSVTMLTLKDAVDTFVGIGLFEADVLLGYNLALLNLDLTTNTLLADNSIDLDKYLQQFAEVN